MNSVKVAYICAALVLDLFLLVSMVVVPIYFTPGEYWWSALFVFLLFANGTSHSKRLDDWFC